MAAIQHYVPRLLLKNFCAETRRIWAFDKRSGKTFASNIHNVAGERDYYELQIGEDTISLEPALSALEAAAAPLFERIIRERSIGWLTTDDREVLAAFVALQMKRGPQIRENYAAMDAAFREVLGQRFGIPLDGYQEMTPERAKEMALSTMLEPDRFAEHICSKTWLLFETPIATPFYTSDNPVSLQNEDESRGPHRGNLGLAVRGIEIHLPISSTLVLAFFCRSHEMRIRDSVDRMRTRMVTDPTMTMGFGPLLNWMRAFRKGTPLSSQPENVLNHNSLQVAQAERYVFCSNSDFALVNDMIESNPELRRGHRLEIA